METISKNVLIESLKVMPENLEVEEVIEHVILLAKIEKSKRQISMGVYVSQEEVKNSYKKWLDR